MTSPKRTPAELLSSWVVARSSPAATDWFLGQIERLKGSHSEKDIYLALGYATRKLGKGDLELKPEERAAAAARPYWDPSDWSIDQAARIAFVLAGHARDSKTFKARLETLFNTADVWELIAFYRGLPLYPDAGEHVRGRAKVPAAPCSRFLRRSPTAIPTRWSSSTRMPGTIWC